jgi:hypothetical protein
MGMYTGIINDYDIIRLSEDSIVSEEDGIVRFNISHNNIRDFHIIQNLCKNDEPLNLILIWTSYKNINYGMFLEGFIMENFSGDICELSNFYGRSKSWRRISNNEYRKYERRSKIKTLLSD